MARKSEYYRDFREHLRALEERGHLLRIKREINKDGKPVMIRILHVTALTSK